MALGGSTLMLLLFNHFFFALCFVITHSAQRSFLSLAFKRSTDRTLVCVFKRMIRFYFDVPSVFFHIFPLCFVFFFFFVIFRRVFAPRFCFAYIFFHLFSLIQSFVRINGCPSLSSIHDSCTTSTAQITGVHKAITNVFTGFKCYYSVFNLLLLLNITYIRKVLLYCCWTSHRNSESPSCLCSFCDRASVEPFGNHLCIHTHTSSFIYMHVLIVCHTRFVHKNFDSNVYNIALLIFICYVQLYIHEYLLRNKNKRNPQKWTHAD